MPGATLLSQVPTRPQNGQTRPASAATPPWTPHTVSDSVDLFAALPSVFGSYQVETVIARGGMGVVYRARHVRTGEAVALKTLRMDLLDGPELFERFRREMRAAVIDHPNVMTVTETGESGGQPYYVMPLAQGNLSRRMSQLYLDPNAAARLMAKVARGVQAAHEAGIIHRDLKPGNVLIDEYGEPRVADFGLARLADELESRCLSLTGEPLGTAQYMAPEQARGVKGGAGPAADVWSLGVMLYEILAQQRPFDGPSRDATLERVRKIQAPPLRQWRPEIDAGLEAVVMKCIEKEPKDRYASAAALADDLEKWAAGGEVHATGKRRLQRLKKFIHAPSRLGVAALAWLVMFLAPLTTLMAVAPAPSAEDAGRPKPQLAPSAANRDYVRRRIDAGLPVELIRAGEPPLWSAWHPINAIAGAVGATGGTRVESSDVALLELTPSTRLAGCRLEATIRQLEISMTGGSGIGLFVAADRLGASRAKVDAYFALTFDETSARPGKPPRVELTAVVRGFADGRKYTTSLRAWRFADAAAPSPAPFPARSLAMTVEADGIAVELERKRVGRVSFEHLQQALDEACERMQFPVKFDAKTLGNKAGIYVNRCPAAIRSAAITQMKME